MWSPLVTSTPVARSNWINNSNEKSFSPECRAELRRTASTESLRSEYLPQRRLTLTLDQSRTNIEPVDEIFLDALSEHIEESDEHELEKSDEDQHENSNGDQLGISDLGQHENPQENWTSMRVLRPRMKIDKENKPGQYVSGKAPVSHVQKKRFRKILEPKVSPTTSNEIKEYFNQIDQWKLNIEDVSQL